MLFRIFRYILILILAQNILFAIEIKNLNQAVDVAGKQRMFSQKMLKDYAMIGMRNKFGNPKKDLKETIKLFSNHLNSLDKFTKNKDIKKSIAQTKVLWKSIKKVLEKAPDKKIVKKLQADLEKLLKLSDNTTKLFAKETHKELGEIVNISGRQRMLSQRMASLYMLKSWGVDDNQFKEKMNSAMELFKNSLDRLENYKHNTKKISILLKNVKNSFMFFEIMNKTNNTFIPTLIYKKSNDILKNMNTITHLYTKIEKK